MNDFLPNKAPMSSSVCIKSKFNPFHLSYIKVEKKAVILAGDNFNFIQATPDGVNIQAGVGKPICIQTMGHSGPFHRKTPWPLTLLPGPISMPVDIPEPPYVNLLPELPGFLRIAKSLALA